MSQVDVLKRAWLTWMAQEATFGVDPGTGGSPPNQQIFLETEDPLLIDGVAQTVYDNLDADVRRNGTRDKILGLKSSKLPFGVQLKGIPSSAQLISGATPTMLSHLMFYGAMFGLIRAVAGSTVLTGTSATQFTVQDADASNFLPGTIIAVENGASPSQMEVCRIDAMAAVGGHTQLTVSPPLSGTPATGAIVRNGYNCAPADQQSNTYALRAAHGQNPNLQWTFLGCAGDMQFEFPQKWGDVAKAKANFDVTSWIGPSAQAFPTAPIADDMLAPVRWLPQVLAAARGSVSRSSSNYTCDRVSLNIPTKFVGIPDPNGLEGLGGRMNVGGRPVAAKLGFDIRIDPAEAGNFTSRAAKDVWIIQEIGTGTTASFLAWNIPQSVLEAVPKGKAVDDRLAYELSGHALPDTGVTNGGATGQARDFRDAVIRFAML